MRSSGRSSGAPLVAVALLLVFAAPAARAGSSGEHRALGWSDPQHPTLREYEKQGALVRIGFDEHKTITTCSRSFLGMSYEMDDVPGIANPDYLTLLKRLNRYDTGPLILRIGAAAADRMTGVWSSQVLDALNKVYKATGAKFILGVNLHSENAEITKAQVQHITRSINTDAIEAFAVGSEPDMYALKPKGKMPGAINPKAESWLGSKWVPTSRAIYKAVSEGKRILAGPGWSTIGMKPKVLKWWLDSVAPTLKMVTLHFYAGNIFENPNIENLLDEGTLTKDMPNLLQLVKVAQGYGLPVRVTEAAVLSYGGVQGVSDVAGSAVWVLDVAMEVCYRGAHGINFHQSVMRTHQGNYNAVDVTLDGRVRVRMSFYGFMMLQQALDGGASIVARSVVNQCKVWVLRSDRNGGLRVLVVNKINTKDCGVDIKLTREQAKRFSNEADVDYLFAGFGLYERWQLYLSGSRFESWGTNQLQGSGDHMKVSKYWRPDKTGGFAVTMQPGTKAMLITIPRLY